MNATFSEGMVQYLDSTKDPTGQAGGLTSESLEAIFTEKSENRLAGRIRSTKPGKTMNGETYELDVQFDTLVTKPPAGKKLDAGGGLPGEAFMALLNGINSNNPKEVYATVSSRIIESNTYEGVSEDENLKSVVDSVSFLLPKGKNVKILGGEEFADRAVLELRGEMSEGAGDSLYLVRMLKEDSGWRYDHSTIIGFL
jgi:hypothetical protein